MGFGCAVGFFLAACSPFAPQPRPAPRQELPAAFSLYSGPLQAAAPWWKSLGDPELSLLVKTALGDNLSLQKAWARLQQARALAVQAGADRFPDLTAGGGAQTGRQRSSSASAGSRGIDSFSLGLVSSYELDLWGRVAARRQAALLSTAAVRQDLATAAVTLSAEVADRWMRIIAQRMQRDLLEEQRRINRTLLELVELRFHNAMVSALDVYQQRQVLETVEAEIPLVERDEQLLRHELAILLGRPPRDGPPIIRARLPELPPLPPTGLPADLLAQRPDVRSAGLRLQVADWQVAAARASRLPAIKLTGSVRLGEANTDLFFDNWLLSLAANLSAPILDGGRLAAEVERTRAVADEDLADYRQTVLKAIGEVEDALTREQKQRRHLDGLRQAAATARLALEEAEVRYRKGLSDYLPVLTQLLTVQGLERDLIRKQTDLLGARIQLHRALGGTWAEALVSALGEPGRPEPTDSAEQE